VQFGLHAQLSTDIKFSISDDGPLSMFDPLCLNGLKVNDGKLNVLYPEMNMSGLSTMDLERIR
jgi:hypothetical protein